MSKDTGRYLGKVGVIPHPLRDRQHTSWTPWNSATSRPTWTGPTYNAGPTLVDGTDWLGGYYTYRWSSPVFDLRPDLRDQFESPKNGVPIWNRNSSLFVQIFGLRTAVRAPTDVAAPAVNTQPVQRANSHLSVRAIELGNTIDFTQTDAAANLGPGASPYYTTIRRISSSIPIEVQSGIVFATSTDPTQEQWSSVLRFTPPGNDTSGVSTPLRYWQIILDFRKIVYLDATSTVAIPVPYDLPVLTIQGAMY